MNSNYADPQYLLKKGEKKAIRKTVNCICAAFLAMSFIMTLWSLPAVAFAKVLGLDAALMQMATDTTLLNVLQIVISTLAFVPPYIVLGKGLKVNFGEALKLKSETTFKQNIGLLLIGAAFCGFANYASSFAGSIFQSFGFSYSANIHHPNPTNPFGIALSVIATAITPAIVEEFAMRGVAFSALRKYGNGFAVLVTAGIFGLLHGNLEQIPFAFLIGLYLGFLTAKTKSIVPAVVLHFYNNLSSVIFSYVQDNVSQSTMQFVFMFYLLIMICFGIVGMIVLRKEDNGFFAFNDGESLLSFKTKIGVAALSPVMLVVYLVVIWESFFVYI